MKKLDKSRMCGILNMLCIHHKLRNLLEESKMERVAIGFILGVLTFICITGCTFSLDGLKATDGEKNLELEHVEAAE